MASVAGNNRDFFSGLSEEINVLRYKAMQTLNPILQTLSTRSRLVYCLCSSFGCEPLDYKIVPI